jgi:hypothetical protein
MIGLVVVVGSLDEFAGRVTAISDLIRAYGLLVPDDLVGEVRRPR